LVPGPLLSYAMGVQTRSHVNLLKQRGWGQSYGLATDQAPSIRIFESVPYS